MHPIDFMFTHATAVLVEEIEYRATSTDDICSVCHRLPSQWIEPYLAVDFVGYYSEVHCIACHALYHSSEKYFGIEQFRGARRIPVFNKLAMLSGCGLLVTPKRTVLFANNFYEKLLKAENFPWELVSLKKGEMTCHRIMEYLDGSSQFVVVGKFNRKKEELVANLKFSNDRTVYLCDDVSIKELDIVSYNNINETLYSKTRKEVTIWKSHMRALCLGLKKPADKKIRAFWQEHKDLQLATNLMPINPHTRLFMLNLLG